VRANCGVAEVARRDGKVFVRDTSGHCEGYDEIVFACHADDALRMLSDASAAERKALGSFHYQRNRTVLHKDKSVMPRRRRCWASWVYQSDGKQEEQAIHVSYWMNRLQTIDENYPLFVTLNPACEFSDEDVFDVHEFHHPVFSAETQRAQEAVAAMQGLRNTWFCGAHLGYGFHEDGLVSAMKVAEGLNAPAPWRAQVPVLPVPEGAAGRRTPVLGPRLPEHVLQT
jgi:predicted NAD/FAD-binding protein